MSECEGGTHEEMYRRIGVVEEWRYEVEPIPTGSSHPWPHLKFALVPTILNYADTPTRRHADTFLHAPLDFREIFR